MRGQTASNGTGTIDSAGAGAVKGGVEGTQPIAIAAAIVRPIVRVERRKILSLRSGTPKNAGD